MLVTVALLSDGRSLESDQTLLQLSDAVADLIVSSSKRRNGLLHLSHRAHHIIRAREGHGHGGHHGAVVERDLHAPPPRGRGYL